MVSKEGSESGGQGGLRRIQLSGLSADLHCQIVQSGAEGETDDGPAHVWVGKRRAVAGKVGGHVQVGGQRRHRRVRRLSNANGCNQVVNQTSEARRYFCGALGLHWSASGRGGARMGPIGFDWVRYPLDPIGARLELQSGPSGLDWVPWIPASAPPPSARGAD